MAVIPSSKITLCTPLPLNDPFLLFVLYILVTVEGIEISVMPAQFKNTLPLILIKPSGSVIKSFTAAVFKHGRIEIIRSSAAGKHGAYR